MQQRACFRVLIFIPTRSSKYHDR